MYPPPGPMPCTRCRKQAACWSPELRILGLAAVCSAGGESLHVFRPRAGPRRRARPVRAASGCGAGEKLRPEITRAHHCVSPYARGWLARRCPLRWRRWMTEGWPRPEAARRCEPGQSTLLLCGLRGNRKPPAARAPLGCYTSLKRRPSSATTAGIPHP